jgi:osmotically-inducible protein OsmY
MKRALPLFALLALTTLNAGCTAVGVGATVGSTAGVAAAREGGITQSLEDAKISATIHNLWIQNSVEMYAKLSLSVDQGRVLITGVVQKPQDRVDAVRLAWQAPGVKQVINEIKVANSEGIKGWARDSWISARLRSAILFDKDVQGVNYSIDTVQATVYLMGVARDQAELDKVMGYARSVPYVKQVVSYVKLAGTPVTASGNVAPATAAPVYQPNNGVDMGTSSNASVGAVSATPLDSNTTQPRAPIVPGRPAPIVDNGESR